MKLKIIIPIFALALVVFMGACKDKDNNDPSLTPFVTSTDPLTNEMNVPRNNVVSITFSQPMHPLTINSSTFTLKQGTATVTGIVEYANGIATYKPSGAFAANKQYTATINTSAKNTDGTSIAKIYEWSFTTGGTTEAIQAIDLGTAANYVILSKTAITNSGPSLVTGNLGISPAAASYITGLALSDSGYFAASAQVTGRIFAADMSEPTTINLTTAVDNMLTAYNNAAGKSTIDFLELGTGNLGGQTLTPGIYKWTNTVTIPSNVTLAGSSSDVWIFQIAGNLTMNSSVNIILIGGAKAENIFWQVAGHVTLGTFSHFEGVILTMSGVTLQTGASLNGRALAQTAVVLDKNVISQP